MKTICSKLQKRISSLEWTLQLELRNISKIPWFGQLLKLSIQVKKGGVSLLGDTYYKIRYIHVHFNEGRV
jgi:hypothetical protein